LPRSISQESAVTRRRPGVIAVATRLGQSRSVSIASEALPPAAISRSVDAAQPRVCPRPGVPRTTASTRGARKRSIHSERGDGRPRSRRDARRTTQPQRSAARRPTGSTNARSHMRARERRHQPPDARPSRTARSRRGTGSATPEHSRLTTAPEAAQPLQNATGS